MATEVLDRSLHVRRERLAVAVMSTVFFALYTAYALSRYVIYKAAGFDLGIFDQAVRAYSRFQAPVVALKGPHFNILGDHFSPIIAVLSPLYWIWSNPCVLLIAQAALAAATIPIVYRFTRRRTGSSAALVVCFAFAAGWAVQAMIDFDFHEVAFAVPLIAWAVDCLDRRDDRWLLVSCGLLLLVREDMGVLVVIFGLLRLAQDRSFLTRARIPGLVLVVAGAVGYELATAVIIPHFAPNGQFSYWQYGELGPNLPSALGNMITHPWHAIRLFFSPWVKGQSLLYLLVPLLFLPFRSRYAWLALPLLAERYYNSRPELWTTHFQYSVLPWLILVLAMVDGASRLRVLDHRQVRTILLAWLLVVPVLVTAFGSVVINPARWMLDGRAWHSNAHTRAQRAVVARIPSDVCVAVDDRLAPHLTARDYVTLANGQLGTADLVAIDLGEATVGGNDGPKPADVLAQVEARNYRVIFTAGTLRLLESPTYTGPSAACHPVR